MEFIIENDHHTGAYGDTIMSARDGMTHSNFRLTDFGTECQFSCEIDGDWTASTPEQLRTMADYMRTEYADRLDRMADRWEQIDNDRKKGRKANGTRTNE